MDNQPIGPFPLIRARFLCCSRQLLVDDHPIVEIPAVIKLILVKELRFSLAIVEKGRRREKFASQLCGLVSETRVSSRRHFESVVNEP